MYILHVVADGLLTIIRNHHGKRTEEGLQVVGQLCPASIARIHRDEGGTRWHQFYLPALKHKHLGLLGQQ